jgi:hypothetical protein
VIKIIWPLLILLGVLFVLVFDQGRGISSPGILLIPIGIVGGIISRRRAESNGNAKPSDLLKWVLVTWALALFSILGLYFGLFTEGFDGFIWILPSAFFVLVGLIITIVYLFKR